MEESTIRTKVDRKGMRRSSTMATLESVVNAIGKRLKIQVI